MGESLSEFSGFPPFFRFSGLVILLRAKLNGMDAGCIRKGEKWLRLIR